MEQQLQTLYQNIDRWRSKNIQEYWIRVDYIGAALNRMGIHTLTVHNGTLWHAWHDEWRRIETGSDFWLFSVPGAFALARDMFTKVLAGDDVPDDAISIRFNDEYGYVEYLRVTAAKRDAANFTLEVKGFEVGTHPDYRE